MRARAAAGSCRELIDRAIRDPASPLHGLSAEAIDVDSGALIARADPRRRDSYAAIVTRAGQPEIAIELHTEASKSRGTFSVYGFGAVFAQVRVDEELGEVRVDRLVGAFAAGNVLNPKTARSQIIGGMVMGIGAALMEELVVDRRRGFFVNHDMAGYEVPVHADIPHLDEIGRAHV